MTLALPTEVATHAVAERMMRLRDEIAESISLHGLTASGRTARTLRVTVDGTEVALWGRAFFPALETGSSRWTGATGVRCSFSAFRTIISDWATAKGLNFGQHEEHERAVSAIAMSIIRTGTAQKKRPRLDVYTSLVDKAVADCVEIATNKASLEIDNILNQWR